MICKQTPATVAPVQRLAPAAPTPAAVEGVLTHKVIPTTAAIVATFVPGEEAANRGLANAPKIPVAVSVLTYKPIAKTVVPVATHAKVAMPVRKGCA